MAKYYKIPVIIAINLIKSKYTNDITCERIIDNIIIKKTKFSNTEIVTGMKLEFADILNDSKYKINSNLNVIYSLEKYGVWLGINNYSNNSLTEATQTDVQNYLNNFENSKFKTVYDRLINSINNESQKNIKKMTKQYNKVHK